MFACLNIQLSFAAQVDLRYCMHNFPADMHMESLEKQPNATLPYLLRQWLYLSAEVPHHREILLPYGFHCVV